MDKMEIEILEDGTLKISTDKISQGNHGGAEALIREIIKDMGGEVKRVRKPHSHHHDHNHNDHNHRH